MSTFSIHRPAVWRLVPSAPRLLGTEPLDEAPGAEGATAQSSVPSFGALFLNLKWVCLKMGIPPMK